MLPKRVLGALSTTAVVASLLLTACGSTSAANNSANSVDYSGTLTVWHDWAGAYLTAKEQIVQQYEKLHPNVKINLVDQTDDTKTINAVKAGTGPDIVQDPVDHIGTLASAGVIVPIDQYESASALSSTYTKTAAQSVQYAGHVFGIPEVTEIVTIMYNKKLVTVPQIWPSIWKRLCNKCKEPTRPKLRRPRRNPLRIDKRLRSIRAKPWPKCVRPAGK